MALCGGAFTDRLTDDQSAFKCRRRAGGFPFQPAEQLFKGAVYHFGDGNMYGGQRGAKPGGHGKVIETQQGNVLRYGYAALAKGLCRADGHIVVAGDQRAEDGAAPVQQRRGGVTALRLPVSRRHQGGIKRNPRAASACR